MSDSLAQFARELAQRKAGRPLSAEALNQMAYELEERLEGYINNRILDNLPPSKLGEFEAILDAGGDTTAFLRANIPNFDNFIGRLLLEYKVGYLSR